jgi:hypothetical protein
VTRIILLDAGLLGLLTLPKVQPEAARCDHWLQQCAVGDTLIGVPEIADFEVRRALRLRKERAIGRLDTLTGLRGIAYLPMTTADMRRAAEFWAMARQQGRPTDDPHGLDCDVVLAAQARSFLDRGHDVVVATTNVRHLSLFVPAAQWWTISAS